MKNLPSNRESRESRARSQVCWFKSIYKEYRWGRRQRLAVFGHGRLAPIRKVDKLLRDPEVTPYVATGPAAIGYCEERHRLLDDFAAAVTALVILHERQVLALVEGKENLGGFDVMIHQANERKRLARHAYQSHLDSHGCGGR